jgi:DNA-binding NarL/FixJ family response regulator
LSASYDAQISEAARKVRIGDARALLRKMGRVVELFEEGKTDREIGEAIGWHPKTVRNYRQVLKLCLGVKSGGRWRAKL